MQCRAGGWLRWRPDTDAGVLKQCAEQTWANQFSEASSRMDSNFFENRDVGVVEGKPVPLEAGLGLPAPDALTISKWQEEKCLILEGQVEWEDESSRRMLQAALLHPSVRTEVERELAAMQLCTSQKTAARSESKKKIPEDRAEKVKRWRALLGLQNSKMREKLWPSIGKKTSKGAKKSLKKSLKKAFIGKMRSKYSAGKKAKMAAKKAKLRSQRPKHRTRQSQRK